MSEQDDKAIIAAKNAAAVAAKQAAEAAGELKVIPKK